MDKNEIQKWRDRYDKEEDAQVSYPALMVGAINVHP